MKKSVINLIYTSLLLVIVACGGGAVGSVPAEDGKNNDSSKAQRLRNGLDDLTSGMAATDTITIKQLNDWWEKKELENSYKSSLSNALKDKQMSVYFKSMGANMAKAMATSVVRGLGMLWLSSFLAQFKSQDKSVADTRYENIMTQLKYLNAKIDSIIDNYNFLHEATAKFIKTHDEKSYIKLAILIEDDDSALADELSKPVIKLENNEVLDWGKAYEANKLDFVFEEKGGLKLNSDLLQFIFYKAERGQFAKLFTKAYMRELEQTLDSLTGVSSSEAYDDEDIGNKLATEGDIASYMRSMGTYIAGAPRDLSAKYDYKTSLKTKFRVEKGYNLLEKDLIYNMWVTKLQISSMILLSRVQRIQYFSLVARYLAGEQAVEVPDMIRIEFKDDEKDIKAISANENLSAAQKAEQIAELRQEIFEEATKLLEQSFERRYKYLARVFTNPYNFGASDFDSVSDDNIVTPGWEFWRGAGRFGTGSKSILTPYPNPYNPEDITVFYKDTQGHFHSTKDLVVNGYIYWDGKYLKTVGVNPKTKELDLSKIYMQKLTSVCRKINDAYTLDLVEDLLYCAPETLNYNKVVIPTLWPLNKAQLTVYLDQTNGFNKDSSSIPMYPNPGNKAALYMVNPSQERAMPLRLELNSSEFEYLNQKKPWEMTMARISGPLAWIGLQSTFNSFRLNLAKLNAKVYAQNYGYIPIATQNGLFVLIVNPGIRTSLVAVSRFADDFYTNEKMEKILEPETIKDNAFLFSNQFQGAHGSVVFTRSSPEFDSKGLKDDFMLSYYPDFLPLKEYKMFDLFPY